LAICLVNTTSMSPIQDTLLGKSQGQKLH